MPLKKTTKKASAKKRVAKKVAVKAAKAARVSKKKTRTKSTSKKKTASRKAAKTAPKSTARAGTQAGKRVLVCANGEHCFWTTDGQILASLTDLRDSLANMMDEVYAYHVTKEKNDFADWVESVLDDIELGAALRRSRKPSSARTVVVRHLRYYDV
ncbi:MAG: hypothetical protein LR017_01100 [Candidatus Pacebacteria bacterium]|nr:hypothetical protein [Candidatus Paceibacterota bacterium]